MQEKECFKCGARKPLNQFYKHPRMKDGRVNKCKECNKRDVRENRQAKIEYYREYDKARGNRQGAAYQKWYRAKNPMRARAHRMVAYHVRAGNMTAKPCENCGSEERPHAHHDDYSKPLDVRWLCPACHAAVHPKTGEEI